MKILIIEDEPHNAWALKQMLMHIEHDATIIGPVASIAETRQVLADHAGFDLIMADIRLTDGLSFDALRQSQVAAPVIFTTAYDEYAIQAFKFNSIDYLLKPIDEDELAAAVAKARTYTVATVKLLPQLFEAMKGSGYKYRERFLIPFRNELLVVKVAELNHVFTENRRVYIRLNDGSRHEVPTSMDELEHQLNPDYFFRANRQYIIAVDSICRISTNNGGKLLVKLTTWEDEVVIVSREKGPLLKDWLNR